VGEPIAEVEDAGMAGIPPVLEEKEPGEVEADEWDLEGEERLSKKYHLIYRFALNDFETNYEELAPLLRAKILNDLERISGSQKKASSPDFQKKLKNGTLPLKTLLDVWNVAANPRMSWGYWSVTFAILVDMGMRIYRWEEGSQDSHHEDHVIFFYPSMKKGCVVTSMQEVVEKLDKGEYTVYDKFFLGGEYRYILY
jgi:hypothetical protein